jgi:hypothetical protein
MEESKNTEVEACGDISLGRIDHKWPRTAANCTSEETVEVNRTWATSGLEHGRRGVDCFLDSGGVVGHAVTDCAALSFDVKLISLLRTSRLAECEKCAEDKCYTRASHVAT